MNTQIAPVVRLFISSTFGDFVRERDLLQKNVFPVLRDLCRSYGANFLAVDLRWGISEEAGLDHKAMQICLEEIERCQAAELKPNFMVLLGQRCGWRPVPARIENKRFAKLIKCMPITVRAEVKRWYQCDDNSVPPHMVLHSRKKTEASDYTDYGQWDAVQSFLWHSLRDAARSMGLSPGELYEYELSATGQEIFFGALRPVDADKHVLAFIRSIKNFPQEPTSEALGFIDTLPGGTVIDKDARDSLHKVERQLRERLGTNVIDYEGSWANNCVSFDEDLFCQAVLVRYTEIITQQLKTLKAIPEERSRAVLHGAFRTERLWNFVGRKRELLALRRALHLDSPRPIIVTGPPGSGKSAFMAKTLELIEREFKQAIVVYRFLGVTADTTNTFSLLNSLLRELRERLDPNNVDTLLPKDVGDMGRLLADKLGKGTAEQPVIVLLDALDQLNPLAQQQLLAWLPFELPQHARIVLSVASNPNSKNGDLASTVLRYCGLKGRQVLLSPLKAFEGKLMLNGLLAASCRKLQKMQRQQVLEGVDATGSPLYIKLAFEEARHWRSFDGVPTGDFPRSEREMIKLQISHLSEYGNHGPLLIARVMDLFVTARFGFAEDELIELLSRDVSVMGEFKERSPKSPPVNHLPVVVWSRLRHDLAPFLTSAVEHDVPLLRFFHRQFDDVALNEFLTESERQERHRQIAEYFLEQANWLDEGAMFSNSRKVMELPWQLLQAGRIEDLKTLLTDIGFCMSKCRINEVDDLINDYASVPLEPGASDFSNWQQFVVSNSHLLRRGNPQWSSDRIWLQLAMEQSDDLPLHESARKLIDAGRINWPVVTRISVPNNSKRKSEAVVLELHSAPVVGILQLNDDRLISWDERGCLALWTGNVGKFFPDRHFFKVHGAMQIRSNRLASWSSNELMVWDTENLVQIARQCAHTQPIKGLVPIDDQVFATWADEATIYLWGVDDGKPSGALKGHKGAVTFLFSMAGDCLLSGSSDGTLRLWFAAKSECRQVITAVSGEVAGGRLCPNGNVLTWSRSTVTLWSPTLEAIGSFEAGRNLGLGFDSSEGHVWRISDVLMTKSCRWIVSRSESVEESLKLWDAKTLKLAACAFLGNEDKALGISEVSIGETLAEESFLWMRNKIPTEEEQEIPISGLWVRGKNDVYRFNLPEIDTQNYEFHPSIQWESCFLGSGHSKTCGVIIDLVVMNSERVVSMTSSEIILWQAIDERLRSMVIDSGASDSQSTLKGFRLLQDNRCAVWNASGTVKLLDLNELPRVEESDFVRNGYHARINHHQVTSAALLENGICLALHNDGILTAQSVTSGKIISTVKIDHRGNLNLKGAQLIHGSSEIWINNKIIDFSNGKIVKHFYNTVNYINNFILDSKDDFLYCWKSPWIEPSWIFNIPESRHKIRVAKIDAHRVACWSQDGTIHILDTTNGASLKLENWSVDELKKMGESRIKEYGVRISKTVTAVTVIDNNILLTFQRNGFLSKWNLESGELLNSECINLGNIHCSLLVGDLVIAWSDTGLYSINQHTFASAALLSKSGSYIDNVRLVGDRHVLVIGDNFNCLMCLDENEVKWHEDRWNDDPRGQQPIVVLAGQDGEECTEKPSVINWSGELMESHCLGVYGDTVVYQRGEKTEFLRVVNSSNFKIACGI